MEQNNSAKVEALSIMLKGNTIESVKETENGLEIVFKEEKFEPEDGDFVYHYDGWISIFKRCGKKGELLDYLSLSPSGEICYSELGDYCGYVSHMKRIATESEKQTLLDALSKDGKRWNAEKKQIEIIRWRAEYGCGFYSLCISEGKAFVDTRTDLRLETSNTHYNIGNYFRTKEEAQAVADRINAIFDENL